ncbi:sensor domain-containing protein [Nocardia noduli]|uniref:sensor domain-containing protein n=1 Tax=Nocardia noduli TaxID=2815722 RepID=UPI001C225B60|nr:sensor domain-containing protein [Nocardia noduli]
MTRGGAVLLAAMSTALLAGCGSDSTDDDGPALPALGPIVAAAPATGPPITEVVVLGQLLLGPEDLPSGMEQVPESALGLSGSGGAATRPAECAEVLQPLARQRPDALTRYAVGFNGPNFSSIDIDAATFPNDKLSGAFDEVQQTLRKCTSYSGTDADQAAIDYRLGGLEQPAAGDASTSFQLRLTSEGFTLVSLVSLVQVGNTLTQVSVTAPESVDPGVLTDLTAAQVRSLKQVPGS